MKIKLRLAVAAISACAVAAFITNPLHAAPLIPPNLANGLDELVASNLAMKGAKSGARKKVETFTSATGQVYSSQRAVDVANDALMEEDSDRIMVRAHLNGANNLDEVNAWIGERVPSFTTTAVDRKYRGGVIEGYVSVDDVPALAYTTGVRSVALELKPELNKIAAGAVIRDKGPVDPNAIPGQAFPMLGTAFDQGVFQHRVDFINKFYNPAATMDYQGSGISIGFISDSYNTSTATIKASDDVRNFDLPGASNNPVPNTQPVVLLQDAAGGTDEGRGMGQIIYKMAPKARIAFATANGGEVGFANNIRALAGLSGFTFPAAQQQGFAADAICDDVGYSDEPFFEDGIIANAVDDVAAAGVSYFSSAGNDIGSYDYDSDYRNVPNGTGLTAATNTALAGTNINLANVPTNLYQGGFHNFNTNGLDVAQTVNVVPSSGTLPQTNFQWDDPYNQTPVIIGPSLYHNSNNHPGGTTQQTYNLPPLTVGTRYVIIVAAPSPSTFDAIVTLQDPSGATIINKQDTGTDEVLQFVATSSAASYKVIVESFANSMGLYNVDLYLGNAGVTTDFNILVFDLQGVYLPNSSLRTNNVSSNVPYEFVRTSPRAGQTQVQYVITRGNIPPASPQPASHFRYIIRGNGVAGIGPAEYLAINTPNTKGHSMARGCNGTAAYPVFRPSFPEYFTSPGPATVYFDKFGTRLNPPEVRLQPGVAAADAGNTSFFGGDSLSDIDTVANFSGTSAAAPHAVAIAGLVLEARGGRGMVSPASMTDILHRSAFLHDLDPNSVTGVARTSLGGKVTIQINSDRGLNPSSGAFNPNSISVGFVGAGSLTNLTFNPLGTAATAGCPTCGNNGLDAANTYFNNLYPGVIFQALPGTPGTPAAGGSPGVISGMFVLGNSTGLAAADVTPTFSNQAPAPSLAGQFWTLSLDFPTANFTGGKVLRFTTGHAQQHDSTVQAPNNNGPTGGVTGLSSTQADFFGGGVLLPDGTTLPQGMAFSGTTSGGGTFSGMMQNRIGAGWTVQDGFGFINAQSAVTLAPQ